MTQDWNNIPTSHQIPHTRFLVDYFIKLPTQVTAFFLTHWHYDHYRGLGPNFQQGLIYCSPITARLLERITLVDPQWIVAKHNNEPFLVEHVQVTFLDANHCPGSVMILFQTPEGSNYLHTGDMRYTPDLKEEWKILNNICLDAVYLDTTYCHRRYRFPCQEKTIQRIVDIIQNSIGRDSHSNEIHCTSRHTLYLIATYGIGKERIMDALIQKGYRIYASPDKWKVLQCLEYWDSCLLNDSFTTEPCASPIWLVGWNRVAENVPGRLLPNFEALEDMLYMANYYRNKVNSSQHGLLQRVVACIPTGWTWQGNNREYLQEKDHSRLSVYGIPYSEHSNYEELYHFIAWLRPKQVIPTVSFSSSKRQPKHPFDHLLAGTQVKRAFLQKWLNNNPKESCEDDDKQSTQQLHNQPKIARKGDILSYFKASPFNS
ncbi:hypothetical protein GpartN1_g4155.t1 [Galdieria partita]|uniref:Metallo-beta-lactamase domain-containing protein n=1 Tax=Galdieria partita TaxID=83374 RepID=A0A9C7PY82_9RHOD|nr:hypothetical protein GpartN1_g4155.t1 [Galdieria partita]